MNSKKSNNLGAVAITKARELEALIDILNNTTIGTLNEDIAANANDIATLNEGITANANAIVAINESIATLNTAITANAEALAVIDAKIGALSTLFSLAFDVAGVLTTEAYTTHKHSYEDATIADTADGSGTETSTTKTTTGVN
ncbi:MAG: hypothetical protein RQ763_00125 [Sulfurimonas sp.]|uniref:hypothetical protein n=1 Tax=Sulfurimonas sp. TaxID=2022749 RepID=UPI0028CF492F|nr:hypothetical protein [Sulfurimonas sp.]MDT8337579.1 hypothetical protein [Sulfurimonas sp.]